MTPKKPSKKSEGLGDLLWWALYSDAIDCGLDDLDACQHADIGAYGKVRSNPADQTWSSAQSVA